MEPENAIQATGLHARANGVGPGPSSGLKHKSRELGGYVCSWVYKEIQPESLPRLPYSRNPNHEFPFQFIDET